MFHTRTVSVHYSCGGGALDCSSVYLFIYFSFSDRACAVQSRELMMPEFYFSLFIYTQRFTCRLTLCHVIFLGATLESDAAIGIRLVNGPNNCSGRVEVFHNGEWGTVCDDDWDTRDARIVCQQMGCGEARAAPGGAHFGTGIGPIWLDGVRCTGTEPALSQCPAVKWRDHNCYHGEDAGVVCSGRFLAPKW